MAKKLTPEERKQREADKKAKQKERENERKAKQKEKERIAKEKEKERKKKEREAEQSRKKAEREAERERKKSEKEEASKIDLISDLVQGTTVDWLPLETLIPQDLAPREEMKAIAKLRKSLKTVGIQEPLIVRVHPDTPDKYQVISGNRRLEALTKLKARAVPCLVVSSSPEEVLSRTFVSNTQRTTLGKVDQQFIATALLEAVGEEEAVRLLSITKATLDRLVNPPAPTTTEAEAPATTGEAVLVLTEEQSQTFLSGENQLAVFQKAMGEAGDKVIIMGILGKGTLTEVTQTEEGFVHKWSLSS